MSAFSIPSELVDHLIRRDCILFVGDDLDENGSQSALLATELVKRSGAYCPFCESEQSCRRPGACIVPLTHAAQMFLARNNLHGLVDFVSAFVARRNQPGEVHRALARLPVRVIVTTAFDHLLEDALHDSGRKYMSITRDANVAFHDTRQIQVIHLHGMVDDPNSLILTEDDAADLFAKLPALSHVLQSHLATKTLLAIGYHLNDAHFLTIYRQATRPIEPYRPQAFSVQRQPAPLAEDRWYGMIRIIRAEPLEFLQKLEAAVQEQRQLVAAPLREMSALEASDLLSSAAESTTGMQSPIAPYEFMLIDKQRAKLLDLRSSELELMFRSALATSHEVGYWCKEALGSGVDVQRIAQEGLQAQDFHMRATVATALGKLKDERFIESLVQLLNDPYPQVRVAALRALEGDGTDVAGQALLAGLKFEAFVPAGAFLLGDDDSYDNPDKPAHSGRRSRHPRKTSRRNPQCQIRRGWRPGSPP